MALLDNILRRTQRGPVAQKAEIAQGAQRIGVQNRPAYPSVTPDTLEAAHRRNELVFACVRTRADALTDPRITIEERQEDGTYQSIRGHPLRRLLMRPSDHLDEAGFFRAAQASMDIFGKAVFEKLRSPAGLLVGLNPIDPSKLAPQVGLDAKGRKVIVGYTWKDGGAAVAFDLDELLIREDLRWVRPPPLEVALGSVDADSAQTDYVRAFFNNAGIPSGILKVKGTYQQPKADALRDKWRAQYGRQYGRQHDIAVLDDNAEYQKIGSGLDELESETVRSVAETRICMVFGVPPLIVYAYVGLLRATYSNLKEAYSGFWDLTMGPLLKDWHSWLTWSLLPEFADQERIYDEQIRLRWDMSEVSALQQDVDMAQSRARENWRAGGITLNEFRAAVGQQADANGDYYLRLLSYAPALAGEAPEATADAVLGGRTDAAPKARKAPGDPQYEALVVRMERELRDYLAGQYRQAADSIS